MNTKYKIITSYRSEVAVEPDIELFDTKEKAVQKLTDILDTDRYMFDDIYDFYEAKETYPEYFAAQEEENQDVRIENFKDLRGRTYQECIDTGLYESDWTNANYKLMEADS